MTHPYQASDVVLGFAESQLAGGDVMCDIDTRRADTAGAELRAVTKPPASTTAGSLAKRFSGSQLVRLERAMGHLAHTFIDVLSEHECDRLRALQPTLDVDSTEVECCGKKKQGFAWNDQGQWAERPISIVWAEAGPTLSAKLLSGRQDPRPRAKRMLAKALRALPEDLGHPRFRRGLSQQGLLEGGARDRPGSLEACRGDGTRRGRRGLLSPRGLAGGAKGDRAQSARRARRGGERPEEPPAQDHRQRGARRRAPWRA